MDLGSERRKYGSDTKGLGSRDSNAYDGAALSSVNGYSSVPLMLVSIYRSQEKFSIPSTSLLQDQSPNQFCRLQTSNTFPLSWYYYNRKLKRKPQISPMQ